MSKDNSEETSRNENAQGLPSRFKIIELIGEGGMASVYKATDSESIEQFVAVKILKPELARDPIVVERFQREAKIAQKLSHPNLVRILDCGMTDSGAPFLMMEYVDGTDLSKVIKAEGHLSVERNVAILEQLCDVLKHAHTAGLVHRDIKPSNILVTKSEDGSDQVKLVDFGIAKPPRSERHMDPALTRTGSILGSPAYMSPEQAMGDGVDERSDIYSLGCVMYESLTGRNPFAADTPVKSILKHIEHEPEPFEIEFKELRVPKWLEDIVMKCLAKKPADRFQRMYLLKDALTNLPSPGIYRRFFSYILDFVIVIAVINFANTSLLNRFASFELAMLGSWAFIVLYFVIGETSGMRSTLGKQAFGLKTYDRDGFSPPPLSVAAYSSTIVSIAAALFILTSIMVFVCGIKLAAITTLSVTSILFIFLLNILPMAFSQGQQDMFDLVFGRKIAKPSWRSKSHNLAISKSKTLQRRITHVVCIAATPLIICAPTHFISDLTHNGPITCVVPIHSLSVGQVITNKDLASFHSLPRLHAEGVIWDPAKIVGHRLARPVEASHEFTAKDLEDSKDPSSRY